MHDHAAAAMRRLLCSERLLSCVVCNCSAGWVNEQLGGLDYLFYIRQLAAKVDSEWDAIKADLQALRSAILATEARL